MGLPSARYARLGQAHTRIYRKNDTRAVRPGADRQKRAETIDRWHRELLHSAVPGIIAVWRKRLRLGECRYFLQRMKTKWGSCNPRGRTIRLNTELVKKPRDLLEYVIVHELLHFMEPTHGPRFVALLDRHFPAWREARAELNDLPLAAGRWTTPLESDRGSRR